MQRGVTLIVAGLAATGCATKQDMTTLEASMLDEIRQLREDQQALLSEIGLAFDSLDATERRVVSNRGDSQRQLQGFQEQVEQLFELASQNNQLLNDLWNRQGSTTTGAVILPAGDQGPVPGTASSAEAETFFASAQQQFNRGAYETSRSGFEDFLESYPTDARAPDAQYYIAETYAAEGARAEALDEYARVVQLWPDSRRAPTALYKSGMLELEMGNTSEARELFQRVEMGYPNSPEADLARDQLRRIRN